jgi:hypothetical protein
MRKYKVGCEEANSWHAIYPVVSVATKPLLVHKEVVYSLAILKNSGT